MCGVPLVLLGYTFHPEAEDEPKEFPLALYSRGPEQTAHALLAKLSPERS